MWVCLTFLVSCIIVAGVVIVATGAQVREHISENITSLIDRYEQEREEVQQATELRLDNQLKIYEEGLVNAYDEFTDRVTTLTITFGAVNNSSVGLIVADTELRIKQITDRIDALTGQSQSTLFRQDIGRVFDEYTTASLKDILITTDPLPPGIVAVLTPEDGAAMTGWQGNEIPVWVFAGRSTFSAVDRYAIYVVPAFSKLPVTGSPDLMEVQP